MNLTYFLFLEFAGRNQAVLKAAPKVKRARNGQFLEMNEEEKAEGRAKRVIKITVSLKQWLINARANQPFIPMMPQAPIEQVIPANPQSFLVDE